MNGYFSLRNIFLVLQMRQTITFPIGQKQEFKCGENSLK